MKSRKYIATREASAYTADVRTKSDAEIDAECIRAAWRMGEYHRLEGRSQPSRYFQARYQTAYEAGFYNITD